MMVFRAMLPLALLVASPAVATPMDDYSACIIGRSAVELSNQPDDKKDVEAAWVTSYALCPKPDLSEDESERVDEFSRLAVEAIASGIWNAN